MATGMVGTTNVAPFIPELWAMDYVDAYIAEAVISPRLDNHYKSLLKKGDTLHIPTVASVTPSAKSHNTAVNYSNTNESWVNVSISYDYYIARALENIAEVQANQDLRSAYIKQDARKMAQHIDANVAVAFKSLQGSARPGTLLSDVTDDDLINCVTYLEDANVPQEDRSWFISPKTWGSIMAIDKFVRLDYHNVGGATATERTKLNYPIYGAPVFVTTNVEGDNTNGHNCALVQKFAVCVVQQQEPKLFSQFDIDFLADKIVTEAIWGYGEERDTSGVCLQGK